MQSWDDVVTDRSLHLHDIQRFLERVQGLEPYRNTHYAFATGGTTGVKGVTVYSKLGDDPRIRTDACAGNRSLRRP